MHAQRIWWLLAWQPAGLAEEAEHSSDEHSEGAYLDEASARLPRKDSQ